MSIMELRAVRMVPTLRALLDGTDLFAHDHSHHIGSTPRSRREPSVEADGAAAYLLAAGGLMVGGAVSIPLAKRQLSQSTITASGMIGRPPA
jgi:hypothetical protein